MTVVTYGLSLMHQKEWIKGRPELMLRLATTDEAWGFAAAAFINMFREEKTFQYQTILTTDQPIVPGTQLRGFFTFAPPLAKPEVMTFSSTDGLPIHLTGFYPIYFEERDLLPRIGLEAFWHHESYDPCSTSRPNLAKIIDPAHALQGWIPSLLHIGSDWRAASDEHRRLTVQHQWPGLSEPGGSAKT